jgi:hypothetical protein
MSSDPKYFRYRGFKSLVALCNYFELVIPDTLGAITENMGKDFVQQLNSQGVVFEQSYSLEAASREVVSIIEKYNQHIKYGKRP